MAPTIQSDHPEPLHNPPVNFRPDSALGLGPPLELRANTHRIRPKTVCLLSFRPFDHPNEFHRARRTTQSRSIARRRAFGRFSHRFGTKPGAHPKNRGLTPRFAHLSTQIAPPTPSDHSPQPYGARRSIFIKIQHRTPEPTSRNVG
ncbi:hypothetical protein FXO38_00811 [Capsicum annuum]|nr:hypothetical protein FXO37_10985 [Capsicum annuum]KAF3683337.1 hypothetical protein FXO38_00811 [Capsicum annuum]